MAIFGLGAYYDGKDVTDDFIGNGVACIGHTSVNAPSLHRLMDSIKVGDIIYLKSYTPSQGLVIKAVGIVLDHRVHKVPGLGNACLNVRWVWQGRRVLGKIDDKYNVRSNTIYEEFNPKVENIVINLLLPSADWELKKLAELMELRLPEKSPKVEVDEESIAHLCKIERILKNKDEDEEIHKKRISIIDLLGVYIPRQNKIILYRRLINLTFDKLCIKFPELEFGAGLPFGPWPGPEALERIVLLHEISHAVTHRGLDEEGNIWTFFEVADDDIVEYFAQIYPYKLLKKEKQWYLLELMNKLADLQPSIYQRYKNSINLNISQINAQLRKERKKGHPKYSIYHQALKKKWAISFGYSGIEFKITADRIDIFCDEGVIGVKDYSPSSNALSLTQTCRLFELLCNKFETLRHYDLSSRSLRVGKSHLSVTLDGKELQLSLKDDPVNDFFREVLDILRESHPILAESTSKNIANVRFHP